MRKYIYSVKRVDKYSATQIENRTYNFFTTPEEAVKHLKRCADDLIKYYQRKSYSVDLMIDCAKPIDFNGKYNEKSVGWHKLIGINDVICIDFCVIASVLTDSAKTIEYPIE